MTKIRPDQKNSDESGDFSATAPDLQRSSAACVWRLFGESWAVRRHLSDDLCRQTPVGRVDPGWQLPVRRPSVLPPRSPPANNPHSPTPKHQNSDFSLIIHDHQKQNQNAPFIHVAVPEEGAAILWVLKLPLRHKPWKCDQLVPAGLYCFHVVPPWQPQAGLAWTLSAVESLLRGGHLCFGQHLHRAPAASALRWSRIPKPSKKHGAHACCYSTTVVISGEKARVQINQSTRLTSVCLPISCAYCARSPKCRARVAIVIVNVTDTPMVHSRCCKICSVRAGLMFTIDGLTHTLTSCEGSDWLKMSMTSSAVSCRENQINKWLTFTFFACGNVCDIRIIHPSDDENPI